MKAWFLKNMGSKGTEKRKHQLHPEICWQMLLTPDSGMYKTITSFTAFPDSQFTHTHRRGLDQY